MWDIPFFLIPQPFAPMSAASDLTSARGLTAVGIKIPIRFDYPYESQPNHQPANEGWLEGNISFTQWRALFGSIILRE